MTTQTLDLESTFNAYNFRSSLLYTLNTFPKAPLAISSTIAYWFPNDEELTGNTGKKYDSDWDTGQAVLLDSYGNVNVDSFHLIIDDNNKLNYWKLS